MLFKSMIDTCIYLNYVSHLLLVFSVLLSMLALMMIPLHMKESLDLLMVENTAEPKSTPVIQFMSKLSEDQIFVIMAEGVEVCATKSLPRAFFLLLISYFVFNIKFPSKIEGSLTFLQKVLINHQDSIKQHPKVLTLLSKLPQ